MKCEFSLHTIFLWWKMKCFGEGLNTYDRFYSANKLFNEYTHIHTTIQIDSQNLKKTVNKKVWIDAVTIRMASFLEWKISKHFIVTYVYRVEIILAFHVKWIYFVFWNIFSRKNKHQWRQHYFSREQRGRTGFATFACCQQQKSISVFPKARLAKLFHNILTKGFGFPFNH